MRDEHRPALLSPGRRDLLTRWVLSSIVLSALPGCKERKQKMEVFAWRATQSAHRAYPVFIVKARLTDPTGLIVRVPDNCDANNGWGEPGAVIISGEHSKPLPSMLEAVWFSYPEDKFYTGVFNLPLGRMQALFRRPLPPDRRGRPANFDQLIVGFGLEGHLSLWVDGPGFTVEVATFQAAATDLDWRLVLDNPAVSREDYIRDVLTDILPPVDRDRLARKGLPAGLFDQFHRRHSWNILAAGPVTSVQVVIRYVNGEKETLSVDATDTASTKRQRPAPLSVAVAWTPGNESYQAMAWLDEGESLAAFAHMITVSDGASLRLLVEAGELGTSLSLILAGPQHRYQFERMRLEISAVSP